MLSRIGSIVRKRMSQTEYSGAVAVFAGGDFYGRRMLTAFEGIRRVKILRVLYGLRT